MTVKFQSFGQRSSGRELSALEPMVREQSASLERSLAELKLDVLNAVTSLLAPLREGTADLASRLSKFEAGS